MNILLVDNDPVYISLLGEILTLYSHRVLLANTGAEALAILEREEVHLIICDVSMPGMNGMDLHIKVRENERWRQVPFAWNSAFAELLDVLRTLDPAVDFKFDKATSLPNLLHFVARIEAMRRHKGESVPTPSA
jgi:two-component system, OmpR family, response regulator VanR